MNKINFKEILNFVVILVVLLLAVKFFLLPLFTSQSFLEFVKNIGVWGYLIIIAYATLSYVFAPLTGTPGILLAATVYNFKTAMVLFYIAGLISAVINFYISRKLGRNWVIKMVGEKPMATVDEFTSINGTKMLWITRILGFPFQDFISYAAGLTLIPFKDYFFITVVATALARVLEYTLFHRLNFRSLEGILIWFISVSLIGTILALSVHRYLKKTSSQK